MSFAGHLDKTVKIKDSTKGASDGMGGYLPSTWATIYKRIKGAVVLIPKGEQIIQYSKVDVFAEFFWYMEYLSGVKESQRVHWGSRVYEIKLVLPWREKGRFMKLVCIEVKRKI
jgi:head-tail adaptor